MNSELGYTQDGAPSTPSSLPLANLDLEDLGTNLTSIDEHGCSSVSSPVSPSLEDLASSTPASPTIGEFEQPPPIHPTLSRSESAQFWLDDLKVLGTGHVQKLVQSWETAFHDTDSLEDPKGKTGTSAHPHPVVQPLIQYWESKGKEEVQGVSCTNAPGHAHSVSSLDMTSKILSTECLTSYDLGRESEETLYDFLDDHEFPEESLQPLSDTLSYPMLLPEDSLDSEPRFVNPKQYHRILKRRQQRAKYLQTHVLVKQGTRYKHASRHEHACRRQRGQGGRFLKRPLGEDTQTFSAGESPLSPLIFDTPAA